MMEMTRDNLIKYYHKKKMTFPQLSEIFGVKAYKVKFALEENHIPTRLQVYNAEYKKWKMYIEYFHKGKADFLSMNTKRKNGYKKAHKILTSKLSKRDKKTAVYLLDIHECDKDYIWDVYTGYAFINIGKEKETRSKHV